jgi:hypothetical protein
MKFRCLLYVTLALPADIYVISKLEARFAKSTFKTTIGELFAQSK